MEWSEIARIVVGVLLVVMLVLFGVTYSKLKHKDSDKKVEDYEIIDGVRYTKDDKVIDDKGNAKLSLKKGDIVLERGKEYKVGKDLLAGKYTVLTGDENTEVVAMRIGGIVKDYKHFSSIVLADGDVISAVSANAVLR